MPTETKRVYTAEGVATGGRDDGRARSGDGRLEMTIAIPGSGADGTNPEELFALGYAACFNNAVLAVARRRREDPGDVQVTARVHLERGDAGRYSLAVDLETTVPGMRQDAAESLVREADERCPYSNAMRGNVVVEHVVRGGSPAGERDAPA